MTLPVVLCGLAGVGALALAAATVRSKPRSTAQLCFIAGMALLAVESLLTALSLSAASAEHVRGWQTARHTAMAFVPGVWLVFALSYARGNAPEFLQRWRLAMGATFLVPLGLFGWWMASPELPVAEALKEGWLSLPTAGRALHGAFLVGAVLILMNLERTFRAALGTMRWRIKFTILALGVLFAARIYMSSQVLTYRALNLGLELFGAVALLTAVVLMIPSLLRQGLFQVDVYPSHALVQNSLTVLLAGAYLLIVGVFANLVALWGGTTAFPLKALLILVSLVALTLLLMSDRVRLSLRRFVSRHLQRPMHDYRKVWHAFAEQTASGLDEAELGRAVVKLISETFQILSVTMWVFDERKTRLTCAASTALADSAARDLTDAQFKMAEAARDVAALGGPFQLESSKAAWADAFAQAHGRKATSGGGLVCVPMIARGEALGVLTLGDRVNGERYEIQDFELLGCLGDQAASALLNIRLSERLVESKELEAFQRMAAFCVHDLKNTASTLSLLMQNLPAQFDNPEFRQDALRAVGRGVGRLNELIARFNDLREHMDLQLQPAELSAVVNAALEGLGGMPQSALVKELVPTPKVRIDAGQFQKVVTNLVLNARDAVAAGGLVRVQTSQNNGCAVLTVSDNGVGMSADFVQRSLFRPFQTSKKNGLGIGLFHCKAIVEAHQGRIEVQSAPGQGTTFRVLLPLASPPTPPTN